MSSTVWKRDRATFFYFGMAWLAAAAALAGFSSTYLFPVASARFEGPAVAHLHGLLFFAWIALLIGQTMLVRRGRTKLHRRLGWLALLLVPAMAVSGIGVGLYAVQRDLAAGLGDFSYSSLIGVVAAMSVFALYVGIALVLRRRPDWHKRMLLLATIAILWPAWFRFRHFLPWIPNPEVWLALVLADSLILVAMLRDKMRFGRVHPAYWIFGLGLIAEHVGELLLFDSPGWRSAAKSIYALVA